MLKLEDIAEGRALLARAKAGEPDARQALGTWFEAWGGLVLDMFAALHEPLPDPKRRFCSECGNRSFWPHTAWCSENHVGSEPGVFTTRDRAAERQLDLIQGIETAARDRLAQLEPEAVARFGGHAVVLERFIDGVRDENTTAVTNPKAVTLGEIERWYRERGLHVRLKLLGNQLMYDFVGLTEQPNLGEP